MPSTNNNDVLRDRIKRDHVKKARSAFKQADELQKLHRSEGDFYFLIRHSSFREAVVALWGMGYHTNQIADFIGFGVTESLVLRALRSYLAKFQTTILTAFLQFRPESAESDQLMTTH